MTPKHLVYNVSARFYQPMFTTLTVVASSEEEAKTKAMNFVKNMKDPEIFEVYPVNQAPEMEAMIGMHAKMNDDTDILKALGIAEDTEGEFFEPVHDPKDVN